MSSDPVIPETMRAVVWEAGEPLRLEAIPTPRPRSGEALVRIAACGVCHSDLHVMAGDVAFPGPAVLGHEISGTIVTLGPDVDTGRLSVGDRVVGAFIMPCTNCRQCERGRDDLCETFFAQNRLQGNLLDGTSRLRDADGARLSMYSMAGLAEYAVIPVSALAVLPATLPLEEAAILGCAAFTAYGAAAAAGLTAGERVAVVATGGIGSSIVQIAAALGAELIIAIDVDPVKLENARARGAHACIDSSREDVRARLEELAPGGVDVAFEALGTAATFELGLSLLAAGGRLVAVGIARGSEGAEVPITQLVRRGIEVRGSFGARTRRDLPEVVALAADGSFDVSGLVTRRFGLEEAADAYRLLAESAILGRAIVVP